MTDETPDTETSPGAEAGDAAPTQEVPFVTKPTKRSAATKAMSARTTTPAPPAKKPTASRAQTDKGRTRSTPAPARPNSPDGAAKPRTEPASKDGAGSAKKRIVEPLRDRDRRTMSAAEYARTTTPSPATTSVIPAVKAETGPDQQQSSREAGPHRQASLHLVRVNPWSVTRLAFAISVAMMIVGVVAVTIFWVVLDSAGVWQQINDSVTNVLSDNSSSFDVTDYLGFGRMVGLTLVVSAINVILMTALATIGAHLYNLAAQLLGGIEVTFAEEN